MKTILMIFSLFFACSTLSAQMDNGNITNADILDALEMNGTRIYKFDIGEFDSTYEFTFIADEYRNKKLVNSDTICTDFYNTYGYKTTGESTGKEQYHQGFIDQIKVISKLYKGSAKIKVFMPGGNLVRYLKVKENVNSEAFYEITAYKNTYWKSESKVPLLIYASSWIDQNGTNRLCGPNQMCDNQRTKGMLELSPNYIVFSYVLSKMEL